MKKIWNITASVNFRGHLQTTKGDFAPLNRLDTKLLFVLQSAKQKRLVTGKEAANVLNFVLELFCLYLSNVF